MAGVAQTSRICDSLIHVWVIRTTGKRKWASSTRLLAELHRDSLYPMMGKVAWVAGADRREAPGPKPVRLGRRLRIRRQPPGSWQLWNGGVQRGVSPKTTDLSRANVRGQSLYAHAVSRVPL